MTTAYPVTPRTRVRRHSERGSYDRELVHSILDEGLVAHVGIGTGLVLARSAFNHSMNYRTVVVYGQATPINDDTEKLHALDVLVRRITPDRAGAVRTPSAAELAGTRVLALALREVSAKVRSGGPKDDPADVDWPVWSGVIPLTMVAGEPQPAAEDSV